MRWLGHRGLPLWRFPAVNAAAVAVTGRWPLVPKHHLPTAPVQLLALCSSSRETPYSIRTAWNVANRCTASQLTMTVSRGDPKGLWSSVDRCDRSTKSLHLGTSTNQPPGHSSPGKADTTFKH